MAKRELRRLQENQHVDAIAAARILMQSIRSANDVMRPAQEDVATVIAKGAPDEGNYFH